MSDSAYGCRIWLPGLSSPSLSPYGPRKESPSVRHARAKTLGELAVCLLVYFIATLVYMDGGRYFLPIDR